MFRLRALFIAVLLASPAAIAAAFQVEARTEAQVYSIRSFRGTDPTAPTVAPRRRLGQYLGLSAYELITGEPIGFDASLRLMADFGLPRGDAARIDGLRSEDADLLYAHVHFRGEGFSWSVGRQTYTDVMDIMAFDGVQIRYVHPTLGIGAEVYTGLWVKASNVLASAVYQPDGVRESDARRVQLGEATPYAALDDIEPLVGAKLLLQNLKGFSASAGFRQSWLSGKTDIQRAAVEARFTRGLGFIVLAAAEYDLVMPRISNARLMARYDGQGWALSAEALRVSPVLSADSIFLYFATSPRNEARLRVDVFPSSTLRFYAQGIGDLYGTNLNTGTAIGSFASQNAATALSAGGSLGAALHSGAWHAALDGTFKTGWGGQQLWVDLNAGFAPHQGRITLDGRVSFANVADDFNARLSGNFVGAQLWGSFFFTPDARASLVVEQNLSAVTVSDTKLFLLFDWKVTL